MASMEVYDGERRAGRWWRVILLHSTVVAVLAAYCIQVGPGAGEGGHRVPADYLLVGGVAWLVLIGLAFILPRLAFSFWLWSIRLSVVVWFLTWILLSRSYGLAVLHSIGLNPQPGVVGLFTVQGAVALAANLAKTGLVYARFEMVSQRRGTQKLPTE